MYSFHTYSGRVAVYINGERVTRMVDSSSDDYFFRLFEPYERTAAPVPGRRFVGMFDSWIRVPDAAGAPRTTPRTAPRTALGRPTRHRRSPRVMPSRAPVSRTWQAAPRATC